MRFLSVRPTQSLDLVSEGKLFFSQTAIIKSEKMNTKDSANTSASDRCDWLYLEDIVTNPDDDSVQSNYVVKLSSS